jgi:gliding motility-associated-like protein
VVAFDASAYNGCAPLCVQFGDQSSAGADSISSWAWNFGDNTTSNSPNPIHCYTTSGSFPVSLTVTSDSGCSATFFDNSNPVNVYTRPVAAFTYSPDPVTIKSPAVQFTDQSTDAYGSIIAWQWIFRGFPDSITSSLQNPVQKFGDTGTFCINLTVTNLHGCTNTTTQCFDIASQYTLFIPDAFTPNADGVDDIFIPKGMYVKTFEMYIFDRWGMKLFYSGNINNGWDGTAGGKQCQEDAYVYLINTTDVAGNPHYYTGKVILLR